MPGGPIGRQGRLRLVHSEHRWCRPRVNAEPIRVLGIPPLIAHADPFDPPRDAIALTRVSWLRRVMTTHPASVNAGSADGERRVSEPTMYQICIRGRVTERLGSALEGMRLESGATETAFIGEIRDQSQLYGLLDRVRDLGLELVSVQPQPAADPTTDDEETYRYHASDAIRRSLAAHRRRQHMEIHRNDTTV